MLHVALPDVGLRMGFLSSVWALNRSQVEWHGWYPREFLQPVQGVVWQQGKLGNLKNIPGPCFSWGPQRNRQRLDLKNPKDPRFPRMPKDSWAGVHTSGMLLGIVTWAVALWGINPLGLGKGFPALLPAGQTFSWDIPRNCPRYSSWILHLAEHYDPDWPALA